MKKYKVSYKWKSVMVTACNPFQAVKLAKGALLLSDSVLFSEIKIESIGD